jgi:hypothetical protein
LIAAFGNLILYFAAVCIVAAIFLRFLNVLYDRQDKEKLKQSILDFWINTSELAFVEKLHRSLDARYTRMKSLRWPFIKLFWLLCILVAASMSIGILKEDGAERQAKWEKSVTEDFSFGYIFRCGVLLGKAGRNDDIGKICSADKRTEGPPELSIYKERENKFRNLVSQMGPTNLLLADIVSNLTAIVVVAIPLTAALFVSLNFTLWILSRITRSNLGFFILVLFDFLIAIIMPPLLTSFSLLILVGVGVVISGQILDLSWFDTANWVTLTIGSAALGINLSFIFPVLFLLSAYYLSGFIGGAILVLIYFVSPIWMAITRISSFISDAAKFLSFDFSNDILQSIIDWAIFTDLVFSTVYLGPSLLLIFANRSYRTRSFFLNLVMQIGDHSEGPLVAIADILSSSGDFLKKIISGKEK